MADIKKTDKQKKAQTAGWTVHRVSVPCGPLRCQVCGTEIPENGEVWNLEKMTQKCGLRRLYVCKQCSQKYSEHEVS